jgi:hypothetical protein
VSEAELILLDFALSKAPIGNTFRVNGLLHNASIGLQERYSEETVQEINQILVSRSDVIRSLLLTEEYIEVVESSTHLDKLRPEGKKAKELGGHKQYIDWEQRENKRKKFEEFPKRKWPIYDLLKIAIPLVIGWIIGHYSCQQSSKNISAPTNTHPKDTIKKQAPFQSSPKLSGKKDSL